MTPPLWIQRELKTEHPDLFIVWDDRKGRWVVRMWTTSLRRPTCRDSMLRNSVLISTVCFRDAGGHDIGYKPLDSRISYALRRSRWLGEGVGRAQMEIDAANEKLEKEFDDLLKDASRDATIDAYRHFDTTSVDMGATRPYRYPKAPEVPVKEIVTEDDLVDME
jgi:hypothetical protein